MFKKKGGKLESWQAACQEMEKVTKEEENSYKKSQKLVEIYVDDIQTIHWSREP